MKQVTRVRAIHLPNRLTRREKKKHADTYFKRETLGHRSSPLAAEFSKSSTCNSRDLVILAEEKERNRKSKN